MYASFFQVVSYFQIFQNKILYAFLFSPTPTISSAHSVPIDSVTLILFGILVKNINFEVSRYAVFSCLVLLPFS